MWTLKDTTVGRNIRPKQHLHLSLFTPQITNLDMVGGSLKLGGI